MCAAIDTGWIMTSFREVSFIGGRVFDRAAYFLLSCDFVSSHDVLFT